MELLAKPCPERIVQGRFLPGDETVSRKDFVVGVVLRTEDNSGLKIYPTHEVSFTIVNGEQFTLPPDMLRSLIPRIIEFCDAAERLDKELKSNG